MGYGLWIYPKAVFNGFKKGINNIGIIELKFSKTDFMKMTFAELKEVTKKDNKINMGVLQWTKFLLLSLLSQVIIFFPFILSLVILISLY